jgi:hypothetical protein
MLTPSFPTLMILHVVETLEDVSISDSQDHQRMASRRVFLHHHSPFFNQH